MHRELASPRRSCLWSGTRSAAFPAQRTAFGSKTALSGPMAPARQGSVPETLQLDEGGPLLGVA